MSFFQKLKILLKKHYIITYSASACGGFRDHCIMLLFLIREVVTCRPLCCGLYIRGKNAKDGPKVWKVVLRDSWMGVFWGCFEYSFSVRWSRIIYVADGWSKSCEGCFEEFLYWLFLGMF